MYLDFYDLDENPFSNVPDTVFMYKSKQHSEAISHMLYGINAQAGFMLLTGTVGSGKTTICRTLLRRLDDRFKTALIFNPPSNPVELIQAILQDLGLPYQGTSKKALLDTLNNYLLKCMAENRPVVIIIDEAQDLSEDILEEIRLLSNLETDKEKLIQIILSGQEELLEKISGYSLRQLSQRITIHYHLTALAEEQVPKYIHFRLLKAGSNGDLSFSKRAVKKIYKHSRGIPRIINKICDKALLAGYVEQKKLISAKMIKAAMENTLCSHKSSTFCWPEILNKKIKPVYSITTIILCILAVLFFLKQKPELFLKNKGNISFPDSYSFSNIKGRLPLSTEIDPRHNITDKTRNDVRIIFEFDVNGVMRSRYGFTCAREALGTILKIWGVSEEVLLRETAKWKKGSTFSFLDHAKKFNLKVTPTQINIKQLISLNYPCIIPINGKQYRYTVLSEIKDDHVVLLDPKEGKKVLPAIEFKKIWSGKAFFVWRDFDMMPVDLHRGKSHIDLVCIKNKLNMLGFNFAYPMTDLFDMQLEKAVKKFQASWGIAADGVFGLQTKLAFYRFFYPSKLPKLHS